MQIVIACLVELMLSVRAEAEPTELGELVTGTVRAFSLPIQKGYDPISMEFVWIAPGVFQMGSPSGERGRDSDERPVHEVEISKGFWLGKYEVTQGEWKAVMGNNPSYFKGDVCLPVEAVSWHDAQAFIGKLNAAAGSVVYRLPTEAEWEYACRAGTQTRWSLGDEDGDDESQLSDYAWYYGNYVYSSDSYTKAVGSKLPNRWGLYDMHGNVWELVQDWYGEDYYNSSPRVDPPGPSSGVTRVIRGGRFFSNAESVRSAERGTTGIGFRDEDIGVRLLRSCNP